MSMSWKMWAAIFGAFVVINLAVASSGVQSETTERNTNITKEHETPEEEFLTFETYFATDLNNSANKSLPTLQRTALRSIEVCRKCIVHNIDNGVLSVKSLAHVPINAYRRQEKCKISLQEILGIISIMEDVIIGKPLAATPHNPANTATKCQKSVQTIMILIFEIDQLLERMRVSGITHESFLEIKKSYEKKVEEVRRKLEFVKSHAEKEAAEKETEAERTFSEMVQKADKIAEEIDSVVVEVEPVFREMVEVKLRMGQVAEAAKFFEKLTRKGAITEIIEKAYTYETTDTILVFLSKLSPVYQVKGLGVLAEKFKSSEKETLALVVQQHLRELSFLELTANVAEDAKKYINLLEPAVQKVLREFVQQILHASKYRQELVRDFAKKRPGIFRIYFGRLADLAYETSPNYFGHVDFVGGSLREFCESLDNTNMCRFSFMSLPVITKILESTDIDFRAKMHLVTSIYKEETTLPTTKPIFPQLPELFRLIWSGQKVLIQNPDQTKPYGLKTLYKNSHFDSYHNEQLDNIAQLPGKAGDCWRFKMHNSEEQFQILHEDSGKYMYFSADTDKQRRVQLWKTGGELDRQGLWIIEDKNWKKNQIILRNAEYLSERLWQGEPKCRNGVCYEKPLGTWLNGAYNAPNVAYWDTWEIKKCPHGK